MRANGRTDAGTDWALRREVDGYIEANGRAVSKVVTGCGRVSRRRPGTRERGQVVSRTVTDRRRTQMEVSFAFGGRVCVGVCCAVFSFHFVSIRGVGGLNGRPTMTKHLLTKTS